MCKKRKNDSDFSSIHTKCFILYLNVVCVNVTHKNVMYTMAILRKKKIFPFYFSAPTLLFNVIFGEFS